MHAIFTKKRRLFTWWGKCFPPPPPPILSSSFAAQIRTKRRGHEGEEEEERGKKRQGNNNLMLAWPGESRRVTSPIYIYEAYWLSKVVFFCKVFRLTPLVSIGRNVPQSRVLVVGVSLSLMACLSLRCPPPPIPCMFSRTRKQNDVPSLSTHFAMSLFFPNGRGFLSSKYFLSPLPHLASICLFYLPANISFLRL